MKWFATVLALAVVLLQYRLWLSDDGMRGVLQLETAVKAQRDQNSVLAERNRQLAAEVRDLKQGDTALEERARNNLGMIGANETFYQVSPAATATGRSDSSTEAAAALKSSIRAAAAH
jgi:cell division protein FtsB